MEKEIKSIINDKKFLVIGKLKHTGFGRNINFNKRDEDINIPNTKYYLRVHHTVISKAGAGFFGSRGNVYAYIWDIREKGTGKVILSGDCPPFTTDLEKTINFKLNEYTQHNPQM